MDREGDHPIVWWSSTTYTKFEKSGRILLILAGKSGSGRILKTLIRYTPNFFNKNIVYKNTETQICWKLRIN